MSDPNTDERRIGNERRSGLLPCPPNRLLYYRSPADRRTIVTSATTCIHLAQNDVYAGVNELRNKLHPEWKYTDSEGYYL